MGGLEGSGNDGNNDQNISVVCRFRPPNEAERHSGGKYCVDFLSSNSVMCQESGESVRNQFTFDHVFNSQCKQVQLFERMQPQIVDALFEGFNATLFCYGQTGAGKTYSMMGPNMEAAEIEDTSGLIPRIAENIFVRCLQAASCMEFTISVSYFELYNEKIQDLLDPSKGNLQVRGDGVRIPVSVQGLTELYVSSRQEMLEIIASGNENRVVSETYMNKESSRSHAVFVVNMEQKNNDTGELKKSSLYLVDLAGSEKVSRSGVEGIHLKEATNINKSLTVLGLVISKLAKGDPHIPYRDSVLTRVLQNSLGGNARTTLLINCSPCEFNSTETLSTLRFGQRAKEVKNRAKVNKIMSLAQYKALVGRLQEENADLAKKLKDQDEEIAILKRGGSHHRRQSITTGNNADIEKVQAAIAGRDQQAADVNDDAATDSGDEDDEDKMEVLEEMIEFHKRRADGLEEDISKLKAELKANSEEIYKLNVDIDELKAELKDKEDIFDTLEDQLSRATKAEEKLQEEADSLVEKNKELTELTQQMQDECLNATEEAITFKDQLTAKQAENKKLSVQMADLQKQVIDLEIELSASKSTGGDGGAADGGASAAEVSALSSKAKKLSDENFALQNQLGEVNAKLSEMEAQGASEEQKRKLDQLRQLSKLKEAKDRSEQLEQDLEQSTKLRSLLNSQMEELQLYKDMVTWEYMPQEYVERLEYMKDTIKRLNKKRVAESKKRLKKVMTRSEGGVVKRIQGAGSGVGITPAQEGAPAVPETSDVVVDWQQVYKTGYLTKEGGSHKSWKRRFFVLKGKRLAYYARAGDREPKGVIKLEESDGIELARNFRDKPFCFIVHTGARDYHISSSSEDESAAWVKILNAVRAMKDA